MGAVKKTTNRKAAKPKVCATKKTRHKLAAVLSALLAASQLFVGGLYIDPSHSLAAEIPDSEKIIALTNNYRANNKRTALHESPILKLAASAKLTDMQKNNYWDHVSPSGVQPWEFIEKAGYNYSYAGENLGKGFSSAEGVVNAWIQSPKHQENLISSHYTEIGVAVGTAQIEGRNTTLIVQMFGKPKTTGTETSSYNTVVMGATNSPEFSITGPVSAAKIPYFIIWGILFILIVFDGIELRRCGLHTSKKHMFEFRSALLINCFAFVLLFINMVSLV